MTALGLFGRNRNLNIEIVVYSSKILSGEEEKKFLYDWYTLSVDEKKEEDGVLVFEMPLAAFCAWK